jgi:hypothetical protein
VPALLAMKHKRQGEDKLWPFQYAALNHEFKKAVPFLRMDGIGVRLYGLRHGGASHDRSLGVRDLREIQQRGGWRSFTSVRRYEKHGCLGLERARPSPGLRLQAATAPTAC